MRIAIIGLGKMGRYHLKALKEREITVETCDKKFGNDFRNIDIDLFDKVIIATPTVTHHEIGYYFLSNKIDTFIEKPICWTSHSGRELLQCSDNTQLMVGHIENFNPVIEPLKELLAKSPPRLVTTVRNGFAPRVEHYHPALDLMIHDVGIALDIIGSDTRVVHIQNDVHTVEALIEYNKIPVVHKVNMLSNTPERRMLITLEDNSVLDVDLLGKKINNYAYPGDALRSELDAFLNGYNNSKMAVKALEICEKIDLWKWT